MFDPQPYDENDNFMLARPLEFPLKEIVEHPDRCSFRVITKVYLEFGLEEDDVPRKYDRKSGRLVMKR